MPVSTVAVPGVGHRTVNTMLQRNAHESTLRSAGHSRVSLSSSFPAASERLSGALRKGTQAYTCCFRSISKCTESSRREKQQRLAAAGAHSGSPTCTRVCRADPPRLVHRRALRSNRILCYVTVGNIIARWTEQEHISRRRARCPRFVQGRMLRWKPELLPTKRLARGLALARSWPVGGIAGDDRRLVRR